jgi:RecA-family ATPase
MHSDEQRATAQGETARSTQAEAQGNRARAAQGLGDGVITLRTFDELNEIPRPRYLLRPMIELGTLGMLYGASGLGKTFITLDMALCVATGRPWAGMATAPWPVLYVSAEGGDAIGRRVRAWYLDSSARCESDDERNHMLHLLQQNFIVVPHAVQIADLFQRGELLESCRNAFGPDRRVGLVVLDTVARNAMGLEENSNTDMGRFIDACASLKGALAVAQEDSADHGEPTILLVHHTGEEAKVDRAIMDEMIKDPQLTVRAIAEYLDMSKSTVGRRVKWLLESGKVTRRDKCYYADSGLFVPHAIMLGQN